MSLEAFVNVGLVDAAEAIARGEISSEALTQQCLARLATIGPRLNALMELDSDAALQTARAIDKQRARGARLGPLAGVPLAHKDLFYRAGKRCTCGSRIRDKAVADSTATVMARLDAAGAVNLGSLALAEFALSPTGYNEFYGHGRNPWNPQYCSGGSSHGSGIAVAARLVYGSLGSDTGGSIRYPAAMCGVTGLKPTFGRVPRTGVMPLAWTLDTIGPIARSARDCARLLGIIAGVDPEDGHALDVPVPDYEARLSGDIRGLRIAVPRRYYYDLVTPEIEQALADSLSVLRERGAVIVSSDVPDMDLVNCMMALVMSVEAAAIHRASLIERPQDYADQVRARIEPGFYYPATRYAEALAMRSRLTREYLHAALGDADVIHVPALSFAVPSIAATTEGSPADVAQAIASVTHCVRAVNYLGLPAISVPAGFGAGSLPVAFQLIGRPFDEGTLLRVAEAYQRDTAWHQAMPPVSAQSCVS